MICNKTDTVIKQYNFMTGIIRTVIMNKLERCPICGAPLDLMELNTTPCNRFEHANLLLFCRRELECGYMETREEPLIIYLDNRGFSKDYRDLLMAMVNIYKEVPRALKKKYQGCKAGVVESAQVRPIPANASDLNQD